MAEHVLLNMNGQRKGTAKDIDREAQLNETILQRGKMPERQGKGHLEQKIVQRDSTTKEEIVVMIESVIIGIARIANTSRKDCSFIHSPKKDRSTRPRQKEKGEPKLSEQEKGTDCNCDYCKSST